MAPASWIQRAGAACAAAVIGLTLLAPPPSLALSAGDSPSHEIGTGGTTTLGVAPNATKRGAESTFVLLGVVAAAKPTAYSTPDLRVVHAGSEAPALTRWRIAHGTSTSTP